MDQQASPANEAADSKDLKQSPSPQERNADLIFPSKPIKENRLASLRDIPSDVQQLYLVIQAVSIYGAGVVQAEVRGQVETACKDIEPIFPLVFSPQFPGLDHTQPVEELNELMKIRKGTLFCIEKQADESSWNERVHSRILEQALEHLFGVEYCNITNAQVLPELIPQPSDGKPLEGDYVITLDHTMISETDIAARLGSSMGNFRRTINPSDYSLLCYNPVAVSIGVASPDGAEEEPKAPLSIWVKAHLNRLRELLPSVTARKPVSITLPLLRVKGEYWSLLFARDKEKCVEIIDGVQIGSTASILGCYKILAAIRCLCDWATSTFRDWFVENILDRSERDEREYLDRSPPQWTPEATR